MKSETTKSEETIPFSLAFRNSFKTAMICFAGSAFKPLYLPVNTMVLGRETDTNLLVGFGLGSLMISLFSMSFHYNFATGQGVLVA